MSLRIRAILLALAGSVSVAARAWPAEEHSIADGKGPDGDPTLQTDADWVDARWQKTDIGQFLAAAVELPSGKVPKAVAVKLGNDAAICFDTELLRYSAGWSGGFLQFNARRYGLLDPAKPIGSIAFGSKSGPGWAYQGSFSDPRTPRMGNLPRDWARYGGMYQSGDRIVFSYKISSAEILDSPELLTSEHARAFARTLTIGVHDRPMQMRMCDLPEAQAADLDGVPAVISSGGTNVVAVAIAGSDKLVVANGAVEVHFTTSTKSTTTAVIVWRGPKSQLSSFASLVRDFKPQSLERFTKGGSRHWKQDVVTKGSTGIATGPLVIDTLTVPYENPWKALMFTSGHDFFGNGDAAVCTVHGDVWVVSGIDEQLRGLKWRRFATGLFQPLGLKIVRNKVHVLGRDGITILHDLNEDGEADYYENFNNDCLSAAGGHSYSTSLETDSGGNFYFTKCAENTPHGGTLIRVSADGQKLDVIATGFRNPNGLGISPTDLITVADQQGEWVPETRVDLIHTGGFYGYMPMHKRKETPQTFDGPLCWIARALDNSAGGEVWIPKSRWGGLGGQMIHLSYGRCTMMLLLCDDPSLPLQAAAVPLPGRFLSGVMRGRFNEHDGNLYLSGLRGWQTAAVQDGCFQRVRYKAWPLYLPVGYGVTSKGLHITFSEPLQRALAENIDSYAIERWNYKWSSKYGSPDLSLKNPGHEGRDTVSLRRASLSEDGRTILLEVEDMQPAMQMKIRYNVKFASGKQVRSDLYATVNKVPAANGVRAAAR